MQFVGTSSTASDFHLFLALYTSSNHKLHTIKAQKITYTLWKFETQNTIKFVMELANAIRPKRFLGKDLLKKKKKRVAL